MQLFHYLEAIIWNCYGLQWQRFTVHYTLDGVHSHFNRVSVVTFEIPSPLKYERFLLRHCDRRRNYRGKDFSVRPTLNLIALSVPHNNVLARLFLELQSDRLPSSAEYFERNDNFLW